MRGWALWPGLDLMVFDAAVNCGVGTSVKQLQRRLRVVPDGTLGPVTAAAATKCSVKDRRWLLAMLNADQAAAYRAMRGFPTFGDGWLLRCDRRYAAAMQLFNAPTGGTTA